MSPDDMLQYDKARPDKVVTINITAINLYQLN